MKNRVLLSSLVAVAGLASAANAQNSTTGSTVTYTMSVTVIGGDGVLPLDPGESALLNMDVSFSGQNTIATYNAANATGTIRGFGSGFVDLNGSSNNGGNANGTWDVDANNGYGTNGLWDLVGPGGWGTSVAGGSNLINVQLGQFPTSAAQINATNPVAAIWTGLWTPSSYDTRTVNFGVVAALASGGNASAVLFKTSATGLLSAIAPSAFGNIDIPIAPAPSSLALLGLGALVAGRRRR